MQNDVPADGEADAPKELPEGSDAPTAGRLNGHPVERPAEPARRVPGADADLPQCARG